jgi:hypothetical protein
MVKPVPKQMMNDLRTAHKKYMHFRFPYLSLDPNVRLTLKELLDFWTSEIESLVPEKPKINSKAWAVDAPGIVSVIDYNEKIWSYKLRAEEELNKVQSMADIYLKNLRGN